MPRLRQRSFRLANLCLRVTPREISQNTTSHAVPFRRKKMNPATPRV